MKIDAVVLNYFPPSVNVFFYSQNELKRQEIELAGNMETWSEYIAKNCKILNYYKKQIPGIIQQLQNAQYAIKNKVHQHLHTFKNHYGQVTQTIINKSGALVSSISFDNNVFVNNIDDPSNLITFQTSGPLFCQKFNNPFSNLLSVGSLDGYVRIYDLQANIQKCSFPTRDKSPVLCLDFDSDKVAFGLESGNSYVYDINKGVGYYKLQKHLQEVVQITKQQDSIYLTSSFDGTINLNDLRQLKESARLTTSTTTSSQDSLYKFKDQQVLKMKLNQNNQLLIQTNNQILVYDTRMINNNKVLFHKQLDNIIDSDISWCGKVMVSDQQQISHVDLDQNTITFQQKLQNCQFVHFLNPNFSENVIIVKETELFTLNTKTEKLSTIVLKGNYINSVDSSYSGKRIVVGRQDGTVQVIGV